MTEGRIIRLRSGTTPNSKLRILNLDFYFEPPSVEIVNGWEEALEDEPLETLRDISIIMREMVGWGVTRQLAKQISLKLNIDAEDLVEKSLADIFKEWSRISEEEAERRWDEQFGK